MEQFRANAMQLAWSAMFWGVAPLPGNGYTLSNPLLSFDPHFSGVYSHFLPTTFAIRTIWKQYPILIHNLCDNILVVHLHVLHLRAIAVRRNHDQRQQGIELASQA